jgi:hypothetical protein
MAYWEQGLTASNADAKLALVKREEERAMGVNEDATHEERNDLAFFQLRMYCVDFLHYHLLEQQPTAETGVNPAADTLRERQTGILSDLLRLRESVHGLEQPHDNSITNFSHASNVSTDEGNGEVEEAESHSRGDQDDNPQDGARQEEATRISHSLGSDLEAYVSSVRYADIVFEVDEARIPAHKAILCARSSHFRVRTVHGHTGCENSV